MLHAFTIESRGPLITTPDSFFGSSRLQISAQTLDYLE
jgi:hypothetical protein